MYTRIFIILIVVQILVSITLNAAEKVYQVDMERIPNEEQEYTVVVTVNLSEGEEIGRMELGTVAGIWSQGMSEDKSVIAVNSYHAGWIHEWQICRKGDYIVAIHRAFDVEIQGMRPPFTEIDRIPVESDAEIDFEIQEEGASDMLMTEDVFHIIVASKTSEESAVTAAKSIVEQNYVSEVFIRENGYYAVTIGSYPRSEMERAKSAAIDVGVAPKDAYFDSGAKNIQRVFPASE
jgi:hypothetical protein